MRGVGCGIANIEEEMMVYLDAVIMQGHEGQPPAEPDRYPPPQWGEGVEQAHDWVTGEDAKPPADHHGCGGYHPCPGHAPLLLRGRRILPARPVPSLHRPHLQRSMVDDRIRIVAGRATCQNQISSEIVAMASEILACMALLALTRTARRWEPRRLRLRLFSAAGRLIRGGHPLRQMDCRD